MMLEIDATSIDVHEHPRERRGEHGGAVLVQLAVHVGGERVGEAVGEGRERRLAVVVGGDAGQRLRSVVWHAHEDRPRGLRRRMPDDGERETHPRAASISGFCWPPSISIIEPFTKWASGDARYATRFATSSTSAIRPSGMLFGASWFACSYGIFMSRDIAFTSPSQRSVRTGPGFTATNVMLCFPYC